MLEWIGIIKKKRRGGKRREKRGEKKRKKREEKEREIEGRYKFEDY